jgi:hypothetical protein
MNDVKVKLCDFARNVHGALKQEWDRNQGANLKQVDYEKQKPFNGKLTPGKEVLNKISRGLSLPMDKDTKSPVKATPVSKTPKP